MRTNLFPALLIAGVPNCGKSVLSFLLTWKLRELGVQHYLLRAVPDGEGDWFLRGAPATVRRLRSRHKRDYSSKFVAQMRTLIQNRMLPLLVDIGGEPQGEQWDIPRACTHSILLYQHETDLAVWREKLAKFDLLPVAELRSDLGGEENIAQTYPVLQGTLGGLNRDRQTTGMTFGALLDRVAGICRYEEAFLEQEHFRRAPFPVLAEQQLARQIGVKTTGGRIIWSPEDLLKINQKLPEKEARAVYGRGPVWLAAMLTAHMLPEETAFFDARYGWLPVPSLVEGENQRIKVHITALPTLDADWITITLADPFLEPQPAIPFPVPQGKQGVVVSGKMPRWLFAALARKLGKERLWVGIDDPGENRFVVVWSRVDSPSLGDSFPRPKVA